ncbi:MAG: UvrD-helicase domain-containing protein [bacterium]|nr:UvrD-helicase domain-containing protein [bacterium]MBU1916645.1 UvrD-helicase domain-containing protein [bacterium]
MSRRNELNPRQLEAVEHYEGPLLILAGAGSGKTRVLIERIVYIMEEKRVRPWNILAVTFTNKAAKEMKTRIEKQLGPEAQNVWMSTFHSFCLRVLRRHAEILGYDKNFVVYDTQDQRTVIKRILKAMGLSDKVYKPQSILYHIDRAKNNGLTVEDFSADDYFLQKVKEIFIAYQAELKKNQAMDFGDLIVSVLRLFGKAPEVLSEYQNKFHYILVDEYQDTNKSQYTLIKLLCDKWHNICVVGDDDQSIYKFRGAEIQNILDFQKDYPKAKVIRLEQNYRSTQNILGAANAVIRGNDKRMGKELWTENGTGDLIKVYTGHADRDEAHYVCAMIKSYQEEYSLGEMAIFYRTNAQSRSLEDELRKQKIAYRIFGGIKFYDRAEIKDIMAYLKALVNPADSIAVKRILNVPLRGIGKTTVGKIDEVASQQDKSFWDILCAIGSPELDLNISAAATSKIQEFVALIKELNQARAELALDDFLPYLYDKTGYWQMLVNEKTIEAESRKENLTELGNVIDDYLSDSENATLEVFLDQISLASDVDRLDESPEFVNLMTVHLAKGLEFPIVFLVGMEEGLFPHSRSIDNPEDIEEERRLCYVGMTRAKMKLHMSFVHERRLFGSVQYQIASRFMDELPSEHTSLLGELEAPKPKPRFPEKRYVSKKPFSSLRKEPQRSSERQIDYDYAQTNDQPFKPGARVAHAVFGAGKITHIEGGGDKTKVTVQFAQGISKKLLMKHANLTFLH